VSTEQGRPLASDAAGSGTEPSGAPVDASKDSGALAGGIPEAEQPCLEEPEVPAVPPGVANLAGGVPEAEQLSLGELEGPPGGPEEGDGGSPPHEATSQSTHTGLPPGLQDLVGCSNPMQPIVLVLCFFWRGRSWYSRAVVRFLFVWQAAATPHSSTDQQVGLPKRMSYTAFSIHCSLVAICVSNVMHNAN